MEPTLNLDPDPPVFRPLPHAPLMWMCAPMLAGMALEAVFGAPSVQILAWLGFFLAAASAFFAFRKNPSRTLWGLSFAAGILCASWAYYAWRVPPMPEGWCDYPPRALTVEMAVDRTFDGAKGKIPSVRGLGRVVQAPDLARELEGARVYFHVFSKEDSILPGAVIQIKGVVAAVPAQGDGFARYLCGNGIRLEISRATLLGMPEQPGIFRQWCARQNARCVEILSQGFFPDHSGIFSAMLLGRSSALSSGEKDDFRLTGTLHLFAISGLHVALIAGVLFFFLRLVRVPGTVAPWIVLALLFAYVAVTGFMPSALRAFAMIAFLWGARLCGRPNEGLSSLAASAICLLLYDPAYLGNAGFQLSYAVVAAILLYGVPLTSALQRRFSSDIEIPAQWLTFFQKFWKTCVRGFWALLAISLAAFLLSSPLCMESFGTFALGGIILNLILVPAATVVLAAGVASLFLGLLGLPAWALAVPNAIGVGMTQAMAWVAAQFHIYLPWLFQEPSPPWEGFGPVATVILLATLVLWRRYAPNKSLLCFLWPFGIWGFLMAFAGLGL